MRLSTTIGVTSALALALLASGCDNSGLTGINKNPNAPGSVTPQFLFPTAITDVVGRARGGSFDLTLTSLWAQHIAMDRFTDEDTYSIRPDNINGYWSGFYAGGLQDLATILAHTSQKDSANIVAPALVMKSWTFGIMTDIWGDIPYSQANKSDPSAPPQYDAQKDIYAGILADLKTASDISAPGGANYGTADLIYNGDATKWKKFANSLRLRYALRLSKVDPTTAQTQVAAAIAAGVFTSNADNALLKWPGDGTNNNPIYANFVTRDDQHMSQTLVNILKSLYISIGPTPADTVFDPRLAVYADPIISSPSKKLYVGAPNGLQDDAAIAIGINNTSRVGIAYRGKATPSILMAYSEVLFDEAEAAARGWAPGDPAALYNAGIQASMQYNGIADNVTAAYVASPRVAYSPATGLQQIALQRWIALFSEGTEAYSTWRRTGVPDLKPGPAAITSPQVVPRRLTYPVSEQSFNNAALQAASAAQGGATLNGRIWWDKP
ncbi:MAG TPA: SusD/RagB family nutrient-binding outer membrane lipoprotein [Gemmatimonadaceae bacterium]|nr:SusD/RagB family nutrient-binding outer membrane lipoprotein [Gemmatimonadaceae bacterium]